MRFSRRCFRKFEYFWGVTVLMLGEYYTRHSKDRSTFFFGNVMLYRQINIYRRFGRRKAFTFWHRQTKLCALHVLSMKIKAPRLPKRRALLATPHGTTSPAIWILIRPANLVAFSSLLERFLAIWLYPYQGQEFPLRHDIMLRQTVI